MDPAIDYDLFDEIILDLTKKNTDKLTALDSNSTLHILLYTQTENNIFESLLSHIPPEKLSIADWLKLKSDEKILPYLAKIYTSNTEKPDLEILKQIVIRYSCYFRPKYGNEAFVLAQKTYRNFEKFNNWPTLLDLICHDQETEVFNYVFYTVIPTLLKQRHLSFDDFDISQLDRINCFFLENCKNEINFTRCWLSDLYVAIIKNPKTYWNIFNENLPSIENFKTYQAKSGTLIYNYKSNFQDNYVLAFFVDIFNKTPHGFEDSIKMCNKFFEYNDFNTNNNKNINKNQELSSQTVTYINKLNFDNLNGCSSLKLDIYKPVYDLLLKSQIPNLAKTVKETCHNFIPIEYHQ